MFVLDSDTYTHFLLRQSKVVEKIAAAIARRETVGITIITKMELLQGRMSALLKADSPERFLKAQERLLATEEAMQQIRIFLLDKSALDHFEQLTNVHGLKKIGRADLLIASIARARKAILVTRNQKHFQVVPQLKLANSVD